MPHSATLLHMIGIKALWVYCYAFLLMHLCSLYAHSFPMYDVLHEYVYVVLLIFHGECRYDRFRALESLSICLLHDRVLES